MGTTRRTPQPRTEGRRRVDERCSRCGGDLLRGYRGNRWLGSGRVCLSCHWLDDAAAGQLGYPRMRATQAAPRRPRTWPLVCPRCDGADKITRPGRDATDIHLAGCFRVETTVSSGDAPGFQGTPAPRKVPASQPPAAATI